MTVVKHLLVLGAFLDREATRLLAASEERVPRIAFLGQPDAAVEHANPFARNRRKRNEAAARQVERAQAVNAEAAELAGGCPILSSGGSVDVYESMPM